MQEQPSFSIKEIMDLHHRGLNEKLDDIRLILKDQNIQFEKRFVQIEKDIVTLREENAKYKTVWGIGATIGATVLAYTLNKIF